MRDFFWGGGGWGDIPNLNLLKDCIKIKGYHSNTILFKGSVSRDFLPLFFSWFEPIWAPDKQPLSIFQFGFDLAEIFDHKGISAVCNITAEIISVVCNTSKPNFPQKSLCHLISQRNRNRIRKYVSLFIRAPNGVESWKNGGRKSCDTLPLTNLNSIFMIQPHLGPW